MYVAQISDSIEQFIKDMMDADNEIELKRNELAQHFGCVPSQINYVLSTRFSTQHGYVIQSKRAAAAISASCACEWTTIATCLASLWTQ